MKVVFKIFERKDIDKKYQNVLKYFNLPKGNHMYNHDMVLEMIEEVSFERIWEECTPWKSLEVQQNENLRYYQAFSKSRKKYKKRCKEPGEKSSFYYVDLNLLQQSLISKLSLNKTSYSNMKTKAERYLKECRHKDENLSFVCQMMINSDKFYNKLTESAKRIYLARMTIFNLEPRDLNSLHFAFNDNVEDLVCLMKFESTDEQLYYERLF